MSIKKRFIAGAICPQCKEVDKLMSWREEDKDYRECVSCGFKDVMGFQAQPRELETRVNVSEAEKKDQVQILRLDKE